jgi:hypothetical protein
MIVCSRVVSRGAAALPFGASHHEHNQGISARGIPDSPDFSPNAEIIGAIISASSRLGVRISNS